MIENSIKIPAADSSEKKGQLELSGTWSCQNLGSREDSLWIFLSIFAARKFWLCPQGPQYLSPHVCSQQL